MNLTHLKHGTGTAYLRVSTEEQNTAHQTREISDWLGRYGLAVRPELWIADEGWSRSDDDIRPGFQRLLALIDQQKIDWIITYNHDRFAASTPLKFMSYLHTLEQKGIELYSVSEEQYGNLATSDMVPLILNTVHSSRSQSEIFTKAQRAVEGVQTHAGNARGNLPPYAFDKVCYGPDGREKWRLVLDRHEGFEVDEAGKTRTYGGKRPRPMAKPIKYRVWPDGRREEFAGFGRNPNPDDGDKLRLAPSVHEDRIKAVRLIFELYTTQAIGPTEIAKILNRTPGINPPPNPTPKWTDQFVNQILVNPLFAYGAQVRFRRSHAQHCERRGGRVGPVVKLPGQRLPTGRKRDRSDWVLPPEKGEAMVSEEMWEAAYAKFTDKGKRTAHAPRNEARWLAGLVTCGGCGLAMRAITQKRESGRMKVGYACRTYYMKQRMNVTACRRNFIHEAVLEGIIASYLSEAGERLDVLTQTPAAVAIELAEQTVVENSCSASYTLAETLPPGDLLRQAAMALDDGVRSYIKTLTAMWREVKSQERSRPWDHAAVAKAWAEKNEPKLAKAQADLTAAEAKLDTMVDSLSILKPGMARDRLAAKIEAQEEVVRAARERAMPLTDRLDEARRLVTRCRENLQEVKTVLLADDGASLRRRSGAALRRVVRRMVVFFRNEDHKSPRQKGKPQKALEWAIPEAVQVVPMVGDPRDYPAAGVLPAPLGLKR